MTMPYTGHPDWIPTNSTPVTVLLDEENNLTPGIHGPFTIASTSGGAYLLRIREDSNALTVVTDISVFHLDPRGNVVHQDFFGGVYQSNDLTWPAPAGSATMCRGNVYGSELQIYVNVAASAFIRAVTGVGTLVAGNLDIYTYIIPNSLSDPEPVVFNGSPYPQAGTQIAPGSVLYSVVGEALAHGASGPVIPLSPYAGPAVFSLFQAGVTTTPTNLGATLLGYSVAGGTTPIVHMPFSTAAAGVPYPFAINLPSLLNTIQIQNFDGAQAATVWASIIASGSG